MSDEDDKFMVPTPDGMFVGTHKEIAEYIETQRALYEAAQQDHAHQIIDFFDRLSHTDRDLVMHMLKHCKHAVKSQDIEEIVAWQSYISFKDAQEQKICIVCKTDHATAQDDFNKEAQEFMAAAVPAKDELTVDYDVLKNAENVSQTSDAAAHENVNEESNMIGIDKEALDVGRRQFLDNMVLYNCTPVAMSADGNSNGFRWEEIEVSRANLLTPVVCTNCGQPYPNLKDRMLKEPGLAGCLGCINKVKFG